MSNVFIARSTLFYPGYLSDNKQELSDEVIIPSYFLNKLLEDYEDDEPLLINLMNIEKNTSLVVSIGTPHGEDRNTIFVPQWILDLLEHDDYNYNPFSIEKVDSVIPIATKVIIKPLDPIAFEIDTLACFEKTLDNLHTLQEGITIPVYLPELGKDYVMFAYIEKVEPEPCSRIVNAEIDVEFINDFKEETEKVVSNTFIPVVIPSKNISAVSSFNEMVSMPNSIQESPQLSNEDRRKLVRDSWLKKFQNNEAQQ